VFEIVTLRMIENIYEASISLAAGLLLGILISWLYWRQKIRERETHIEELETDLIEKVENLNARAQEQGTNLERLNSESKQKEEQIKDLNAKIREKDDTITSHEEKVAELKKQKDERLAQIAATENNARELERTLAEKEQEVTTLSARINSMQDDLSTLDGIGPKVSTVLRLAGITSFSRLASTGIDKIREILEAENPNLLRLTDPSTWSEQARMAADGDWEALSALQNDLKNARRTREPSKEEDTP
jgi:predicted flap endonuclease-1-like 5' DNA nuclease